MRGIPPSFTQTFASNAVAGGTEAVAAAGAETTLITRASLNGNGAGLESGVGNSSHKYQDPLTVTNGGGRLLKKHKSSSEEDEDDVVGIRELTVGLLGSSEEKERKN